MGNFKDAALQFGMEVGSSIKHQSGVFLDGYISGKLYNTQSNIKYVSYRSYDNIYTFELRRDAFCLAHNAARKLVDFGANKLRDQINQTTVLEPTIDLVYDNYKKVADYGFAKLKISDNTGTGTVKIPIYNELGERITDGLVLSFEAPQSYKYISNLLFGAMNGTVSNPHSIDTTTVFFIDTAPKINFSSTKKLIMTPVQGRNNTRKELLGGGDTIISISGNIMTQMPGNKNFKNRQEYPHVEVNTFRRIVEYNGIVDISHFMCGNMGITKCIVQDFKLGEPQYANMQPYSLTCVAIEPDEANIAVDVISVLDQQIAKSKKERWYDSILDIQKASRTAKNYVVGGIDKLVSTI